jgi:hypothetical protein
MRVRVRVCGSDRKGDGSCRHEPAGRMRSALAGPVSAAQTPFLRTPLPPYLLQYARLPTHRGRTCPTPPAPAVPRRISRARALAPRLRLRLSTRPPRSRHALLAIAPRAAVLAAQ